MKEWITLIFCLLLISGQVNAQEDIRYGEPVFELSYEGMPINIEEGIYIPRSGTFRLDLVNQDQILSNLPDHEAFTLLESEAILLRGEDEVMHIEYFSSECINNDLDLSEILQYANANDAIAFEIHYVYVNKKGRKSKIIREGVTRINIDLK